MNNINISIKSSGALHMPPGQNGLHVPRQTATIPWLQKSNPKTNLQLFAYLCAICLMH